MAGLGIHAVVLTASIDDEDGVRRWVEYVGKAAAAVQQSLDAVQQSLDDLAAQLRDAPHISITLTQHEPERK